MFNFLRDFVYCQTPILGNEVADITQLLEYDGVVYDDQRHYDGWLETSKMIKRASLDDYQERCKAKLAELLTPHDISRQERDGQEISDQLVKLYQSEIDEAINLIELGYEGFYYHLDYEDVRDLPSEMIRHMLEQELLRSIFGRKDEQHGIRWYPALFCYLRARVESKPCVDELRELRRSLTNPSFSLESEQSIAVLRDLSEQSGVPLKWLRLWLDRGIEDCLDWTATTHLHYNLIRSLTTRP